MIGISKKDFFSLTWKEAEEKFNTLPIEEQITKVFEAPWEDRQKLILMSVKAPVIVRNMPVQELYWTIKASGPADSLPLLSMAASSQLQFILDMEIWKKDKLDTGKVVSWLLMIIEAGDDCLSRWIRWIKKHDDYLLSAILRRFISVQKRPDDMEIEEARQILYPFTVDNNYFINFKFESLRPVIQYIINSILENSSVMYIDTMETLLEMTDSSNSETSYRLKVGRLNDEGVPDYYDSLSIYEPVSVEQVKQRVSGFSRRWSEDDAAMPAFVPTLYMADYPRLNQAVNDLAGTHVMERIINEWVGVTNKLLITDNIDIDDSESLRNAVLATSALINAGLDILIWEYGDSSASYLSAVPLEDLVKLSNSEMKRLANRAKKIFFSNWSLRYLPTIWQDTIRGLFMERPMVWNEESSFFQPIKSKEDFLKVEKIVKQGQTSILIAENITPPCSVWREKINWQETNFLSDQAFTLQAGLATVFVNCITGEGPYMLPLTSEQLSEAALFFSGASSSGNAIIDAKHLFYECVDKIIFQVSASKEDVLQIFESSLPPLISELKALSDPVSGEGEVNCANFASVLLQTDSF